MVTLTIGQSLKNTTTEIFHCTPENIVPEDAVFPGCGDHVFFEDSNVGFVDVGYELFEWYKRLNTAF